MGFLELISRGKKKERKAAEYRVLYAFRNPTAANSTDTMPKKSKLRGIGEAIQRLILGGKTNKEIMELTLGATKQNIYYHRRKLGELMEKHAYLSD